MFFTKKVNQSNSSTAATSPVNVYTKKNCPILEPKEQKFIIVTGVIYLTLGVLSLISTILSIQDIITLEKLLSAYLPSIYINNIKIGIIVGSAIGLGLNIFFAAMMFLYKRWAFLTVRIFYIIGMVGLFFSISPIMDVNESLATFYILYLGFDIMMLCFINIAAKALSSDVQSCREITRNANTK
ncbi:MAG: hypothetical protein HDT47_00785 [Ruminococcaceae bacterium]|nr:hypothetical protein [Oscillospiraceae bacterium]